MENPDTAGFLFLKSCNMKMEDIVLPILYNSKINRTCVKYVVIGATYDTVQQSVEF